MSRQPQIIVFPGLGETHESCYTFSSLPYDVVVFDYIATLRGESLEDYVERWAVIIRERIDPRRRAVFVGISLGSAVAQEMSRHIRADALVLISGYRSVSEINAILRFLGRVVAPVLPVFAYKLLIPLAPLVVKRITKLRPADTKLLSRLYRSFPKRWFRDHCRMAVTWKSRAVDAPILRIHGQKDPVIPYGDQKIDLLIPGDRHMCNLSHPEQVNRAIEDFLAA